NRSTEDLKCDVSSFSRGHLPSLGFLPCVDGPGLFQFLGRRNDFWIMALEAGLFPFPNEAVHDEFLENSGIVQRALSGCRRSDPCRLRQVQALGDHSTNIASRGTRARLAGPGPRYHADRG